MTELMSLGAVAAIEFAVEEKMSWLLMGNDGDKLSYLLPQTSVRREMRS